MPPNRLRLSAEERLARAEERVGAGSSGGRSESASPVRREKLSGGRIESGGHDHNGTGVDSTVVAGSLDSVQPLAVGDDTFAGGEGATALGINSVAIGPNSFTGAGGDDAVAIGNNPSAEGIGAVAIGNNAIAHSDFGMALGYGANAFQSGAVAIGTDTTGAHATSRGNDQFKLGTPLHRVHIPAPNSAQDDTELDEGFITFWLDESGDNLTVRVRYSGGAYKTGTIALS